MKKFLTILTCLAVVPFFAASCSEEESGSQANTENDIYSASSLLERIKANKDISLKTDIDLNDFEWPTNLTYSATFEGNSHKISNLKLKTNSQNSNVGFISNNTGTIKNLVFEDADVEIRTEGNNCGVLCGVNNGRIEGITATGKIAAQVYSSVGGIIGFVNEKGFASQLTNYVNVHGLHKVGGAVGAWHTYYKDAITISDLTNYGSIKGTDDVGGTVGFFWNTSGVDWNVPTMSNCKNSGEINGNNYVGGILGYNSNNRSDYGTSYGSIRFIYCENEGNVTGSGNNVAGIVGEAAPEHLTNCKNSGDITGSGHVAGIMGWRTHYGYFECDYFLANNCINEGTITATGEGGYNGGLFGRGCGRIFDSSNYGMVKSLMHSAFNGGIAGTFEIGAAPHESSYVNKINNDSKVYNLVNKGDVIGGNSTGGIFGDVGGRPDWYSVSNLKNEGNVFGWNKVGGIIGGITTGYQPKGPGSPDYTYGMKINLLYSDNYGKIDGKDYVYGIIGDYQGGRLNTSDEHKNTLLNTGEITAEGEHYGELYK